MKIIVKEISKGLDDNNWFKEITNSLQGLDCKKYVEGLINFSQKKQKRKVAKLQNFILKILEEQFVDFQWQTEFKVSEKRDAIDIYGKRENDILIIELDKWRADQVAKKLISRTALLKENNIGFVSLCYAGTPSMNKSECLKYFQYGNIVLTELNNYYAGMIIE
ncbi:hypothetical protein A9Q93_09780 [Nonlabens dokdonensis]|uniref:Restriction endonuclease type IV Mrr domain-containing protein n=1 Tax=Nonlabens dokdonensis TaxID=328515 RepID=A0A1Z8ARA3_9FLAO|nr:hypothetical protein [Nonlabens dokdonensis]OUS12882.1 hypothetical protein A9Q93_09780 [Nonlabens dokdonensis]